MARLCVPRPTHYVTITAASWGPHLASRDSHDRPLTHVLVAADLGTMQGGRHMAETGPRPEGAPGSAAELAARFREHALGKRLQSDLRSQAHMQLNPKITEAVRNQQKASAADDAEWVKPTDRFDNVQRSVEFAKATDRLIIASFGMQLSAAIRREVFLVKARMSDTISGLIMTVILGLIIGFLFFQLPVEFDRLFDRLGVILELTTLSAVGVFNVVPMIMNDRDVRAHGHSYHRQCVFSPMKLLSARHFAR